MNCCSLILVGFQVFDDVFTNRMCDGVNGQHWARVSMKLLDT